MVFGFLDLAEIILKVSSKLLGFGLKIMKIFSNLKILHCNSDGACHAGMAQSRTFIGVGKPGKYKRKERISKSVWKQYLQEQ